MTTATPASFFAIVVDHTHSEFDVHGPMTNDAHLCDAVCELQEGRCKVTLRTRAWRGRHENLEMAVDAVGRELGLVHRAGLLRRQTASAG